MNGRNPHNWSQNTVEPFRWSSRNSAASSLQSFLSGSTFSSSQPNRTRPKARTVKSESVQNDQNSIQTVFFSQRILKTSCLNDSRLAQQNPPNDLHLSSDKCSPLSRFTIGSPDSGDNFRRSEFRLSTLESLDDFFPDESACRWSLIFEEYCELFEAIFGSNYFSNLRLSIGLWTSSP